MAVWKDGSLSGLKLQRADCIVRFFANCFRSQTGKTKRRFPHVLGFPRFLPDWIPKWRAESRFFFLQDFANILKNDSTAPKGYGRMPTGEDFHADKTKEMHYSEKIQRDECEGCRPKHICHQQRIKLSSVFKSSAMQQRLGKPTIARNFLVHNSSLRKIRSYYV